MTTDVQTIFEKESIIPDILAPGTKVPRNLKVIWPNAKLEKPGQMIERDETQPQPTLFVEPSPEDKESQPIYTLLMVDPDLTHRNDKYFGQVRHWLTTRVTVSPTGQVNVSKDRDISPYVGPAPIPAHYFTLGKPHPSRYTFLLLRHKTGVALPELNPDSLRAAYEGSPGEFGQPTQDIVDRMRFSTEQFIERNKMEVVAGTFMLVEGNAKSAVKNASLVAQGLADKMMGK
ncbi:hypothetical protein DTO164E3_6377 [Paecilomyces variotii]|nr:hypothetical protein DTO164E3_6377 [Paecilomyces variotii]KAJ9221393.1 hypothetical protein DTO169C6_6220 [Paecilomyces variotii]KAJ9288816.1 hypothetical protein DTO021C3_3616 [Paecilomyces variotii]KAJ9357355.1 hypothetical protein DTO027B9_3058 [Paecilomyces variotii]KAJ9377454.1 hypothetical protein DTO063F5_8264 [Paecilomyces variotii]